jgi:hypothetical protein
MKTLKIIKSIVRIKNMFKAFLSWRKIVKFKRFPKAYGNNVFP